MLLLVAAAAAHVPFERGYLTVTEVHVGAAADGGQWFEVRNDTASTQNLVEQVFTDADGDSFQVALGVLVRSGEFAVFASEDSTVDADYHFPAAFDLRADAGAVVHTDLRGTVDEVRWDATWGVSGAWQLDLGVAANEWANDLAGNWCSAGLDTGSTAAVGTPGADNTRCPGTDTDDDGDGFTELDGDCDDRDPTVFPGAHDGPGVQNDGDCDGTRDEDPAGDTGTPVDTGGDTGDTGDSGDTGADTSADTGVDSGGDSGSVETGDTDETGDTGGHWSAPRPDDPAVGCGCGGDSAGLAGVLIAGCAGARRRRGRIRGT